MASSHLPITSMMLRLAGFCFVSLVVVVARSSQEEDDRTTYSTNGSSSSSFLEQARQLEAPTADATLDAEFEGAEFWERHQEVLRGAWCEWSEMSQHQDSLLLPDSSLLLSLDRMIHSDLQEAVETAWDAAERHDMGALQQAEQVLREQLWHPVAPGVYVCQHFFDTNALKELHQQFDVAEKASGIPTRRPNGMNRYGVIVDRDVPGAVQLSSLTDLGEALVRDYVRPIGRLLFLEYVGFGNDNGSRSSISSATGEETTRLVDDAESLSFTVRYKPGEDLSLKEHSDASLYTLNVNLNMPTEHNTPDRSLPDLYFVDDVTGQRTNVTVTPGMAVLHRGLTRHAAWPLAAHRHERTQWVFWTFGKDDGYVRVAPYAKAHQLTPLQRWTRTNSQDETTAAAFGAEGQQPGYSFQSSSSSSGSDNEL